jgi:hypothetical protein
MNALDAAHEGGGPRRPAMGATAAEALLRGARASMVRPRDGA